MSGVNKSGKKADCFCLYCESNKAGWCREKNQWCYTVKDGCFASQYYLDQKRIDKKNTNKVSKSK